MKKFERKRKTFSEKRSKNVGQLIPRPGFFYQNKNKNKRLAHRNNV